MSILKEALKRQMDTSGNLLLRASKTLSKDEFFLDPSSGPSMAWTLGHITALQDWSLHQVFQNVECQIDHEAREALKGGRPIRGQDRKFFNDKEKLEKEFSATQLEMITLLNSFDEEKWNQSPPSGGRFSSYGSLWEHLAVHNFWHLGQLASTYPKLTSIVLLAPRDFTVDPDE